MLQRRSLITLLALAAALVLIDAQFAQARQTRVDAQLASLSKSLGNHAAEPGCCAPKPVCCPAPCITYRHCGPKLCCGCEPSKPIVLKVKDPCTGCETDVHVCLPACCEGEPTICCGKGFLCRDIVEYEWCCGFYVRVAFKKCGDLIVTTKGR
jgi:hypothetical protein